MSSQASSAGRDEAKVRQKLVETGHVDVMIAIRSNFFYTRSVPCELWFLNKSKPKEHREKVLMIDARNIFRKVTRRIFDLSPEQLQNILAVVWLYRGQSDRFKELVDAYLQQTVDHAVAAQDRLETVQKSFASLVRPLASALGSSVGRTVAATSGVRSRTDWRHSLRLQHRSCLKRLR